MIPRCYEGFITPNKKTSCLNGPVTVYTPTHSQPAAFTVLFSSTLPEELRFKYFAPGHVESFNIDITEAWNHGSFGVLCPKFEKKKKPKKQTTKQKTSRCFTSERLSVKRGWSRRAENLMQATVDLSSSVRVQKKQSGAEYTLGLFKCKAQVLRGALQTQTPNVKSMNYALKMSMSKETSPKDFFPF